MLKNNLAFLILFKAFFLFLSQSISAQTPKSLMFPVDCELGKTCVIAHYMDVDPTENAADFMCGNNTYDGNTGTTIALHNRNQMSEGINVRAAADGIVQRYRDGESDSIKTEEQIHDVRDANRECGNGVVIRHGPGFSTFYCHMRAGSLSVKNGQKIKQGDIIGQVGQSGIAKIPSLQFSLIWESGYIDPFSNKTNRSGCNGGNKALWQKDIAYAPFSIIRGGFQDGVPDFSNILKIAPKNKISTSSEALVYWTGYYHGKNGDRITIEIRDPDAHMFRQKVISHNENRQDASFFYTGRKVGSYDLKPGEYSAKITFFREGVPQVSFTDTVLVED